MPDYKHQKVPEIPQLPSKKVWIKETGNDNGKRSEYLQAVDDALDRYRSKEGPWQNFTGAFGNLKQLHRTMESLDMPTIETSVIE
jgi:hypothetical protein